MHVLMTGGAKGAGKTAVVSMLSGMDPVSVSKDPRKGLTIGLGFSFTTLPNGEDVAFIDPTSDSRREQKLVANSELASGCLFVVAADRGWTHECEDELQMFDLLEMDQAILVVSRTQGVDAQSVRSLRRNLLDYTSNSFLADAEVVEVDAYAGIGEDELQAAVSRLISRSPDQPDRGRPRFWVETSFGTAAGTVVTGSVFGGELKAGNELTAVPGDRAVRIRGIRTHRGPAEHVASGSRVAINLTGVDPTDVPPGTALVRAGDWGHTAEFEASITVSMTTPTALTASGDFSVIIGSGEFPAALRPLARADLPPGGNGPVLVTVDRGLTLLSGDHCLIRDRSTGTIVGGGFVLEAANIIDPAHYLTPTLADELIEKRGVIDVEELARLTGERRAPTFGRWVIDPLYLVELTDRLRAMIVMAGAGGLDLSTLSEAERALVATLDGIEVAGGVARTDEHAQALRDSLQDHPFVHALGEEPFISKPAPAATVPEAETKELTRRGIVVEQGGKYFARKGIDEAARRISKLLQRNPQGVSVRKIAEELDITPAQAKPLLKVLDREGITVPVSPAERSGTERSVMEPRPAEVPTPRREHSVITPIRSKQEDFTREPHMQQPAEKPKVEPEAEREEIRLPGPNLPKPEIDLRQSQEQRRSRDTLQI